MGQRYHVLTDSEGYTEQGVASWYGREFHGRRTSNGEVYDMYAMTAAHKTLPLPTTARVTNLSTGKSIIVRINDRGPFKKGRLIDLSYGAARELGFLNTGTAMVEVQALPGEAPAATIDTPPDVAAAAQPPPPARAMYAQVGAFGQRQNAEDLKRRLEQQGLRNVVIRYDAGAAQPLYRVRVGPVADAAQFDAVVSAVGRMKLGEPRLVVENGDGNPGG
jgi:rare lipoprotein A